MEVGAPKFGRFSREVSKSLQNLDEERIAASLDRPTLTKERQDRGEIKMSFDVIGPSIHRIGSLSVHLLRQGHVGGWKPFSDTQPVQPCTPTKWLVEQAMDVGPPDQTVIAHRAVEPRIIPFGDVAWSCGRRFFALQFEASSMSMAIRPSHVNQVPSNRWRRRPTAIQGTPFHQLGESLPPPPRRHRPRAAPPAAHP